MSDTTVTLVGNMTRDIARIQQVGLVPLIRVAPADACQVGSGTLGTPLEGVVIDEFARNRIVP